MNFDIEGRVKECAELIAREKCTVRQAAARFGISKSTVHSDMSVRLPLIDPCLYAEVEKVLKFNLSVRHLRGGESTRKKYRAIPKDCCVRGDK